MNKRNLLMIIVALFAFFPLSVFADSSEMIVFDNPNISYEDVDESESITPGDILTMGTESFFVIDTQDEGAVIRLLAETRIDCTELVQDENAEDLEIETNDNYGNSGVPACINSYVEKLNTDYDASATSDLFKKSQLQALGFSFSGANGTYNGGYDWLLTTDFYYFHHHNTYNMDFVGRVYADGENYRAEELTYGLAGVRPFIRVPVEILNNHTVTLNETENGTVDVIVEGDGTITLDITPSDNYEVESIEVLDADGNPVEVTDNNFTMPDSDVTITVTFKEKEPESNNPKTADHVVLDILLLLFSVTSLVGAGLYLKKTLVRN
jgi:hypothetical protein